MRSVDRCSSSDARAGRRRPAGRGRRCIRPGSRPRGPPRRARCLDRGTEQVHLVAAVVDVELARHLGAGCLQHPGDGVADHGPAGVAEVDRAGRVRGDELHVDPLAGWLSLVPYAVAGGHDVCRHLALRPGLDGDVEEARARRPRRRRCRQSSAARRASSSRQRPRVGARLLRELHRHVGGVVAVPLLSRALHRDLGRHALGQISAPWSTASSGRRRPRRRVQRDSPVKPIGALRSPHRFHPGTSAARRAGPASAGPRSSGDRALLSGGRSAGSNPAGGAISRCSSSASFGARSTRAASSPDAQAADRGVGDAGGRTARSRCSATTWCPACRPKVGTAPTGRASCVAIEVRWPGSSG